MQTTPVLRGYAVTFVTPRTFPKNKIRTIITNFLRFLVWLSWHTHQATFEVLLGGGRDAIWQQ